MCVAGEMLCWGDGDIYSDAIPSGGEDGAADARLDGAALRQALKQDPSNVLPPKGNEGRRHLRGHPAGDARSKVGDGYYRWVGSAEEAKGVDVDTLPETRKTRMPLWEFEQAARGIAPREE